jgi:phage repressor protein C with HTH and peptisase S24 domain
MDTPQERLEYFISKFFQSKTDFAKALGVTLPNLNKYLGKDSSVLGASYHSKMIELNLNPTWYTTGKGTMLFEPEKTISEQDKRTDSNRSPYSWMSNDAYDELQDILNITLYLTPEAKMGQPLSFSDIPSTVTTFRNYIAPSAKKVSAIIARGESMIEDGIEDGDLVFFEAGINPRNKQIVVAEFEDSILIKRYVVKEDGVVYLESSNEKFKPIKVTGEEHFKIIGVFRGFFRNQY